MAARGDGAARNARPRLKSGRFIIPRCAGFSVRHDVVPQPALPKLAQPRQQSIDQGVLLVQALIESLQRVFEDVDHLGIDVVL